MNVINVKASYNSDGERLEDNMLYLPAEDEFFDGRMKPRWNEYLEYADEYGFDIRHNASGRGYIEKVILPAGKMVIRYGNDVGSFTTDKGVEYKLLSLPYLKSSMPYHEYVIQEDCEVLCYVDKGIVAPGFGSRGGAVQYRHYMTIFDSIRRGLIEEDYSWLERIAKQ